MIAQVKRVALPLLAGVLLFGCGNSSAQLSVDARKIMSDGDALNTHMASPGNAVRLAADDFVRRVQSLPRCERGVVAAFYIKKLYSLGSMEVAAEKLPVWLYNFQELLKTVDLYADDLDDKEAPLRLYELCVDRYLKGISSIHSRANASEAFKGDRSRQELLRSLETDELVLFANIQKAYLPLVAARLLPKVKYEQWKLRLEAKMRESQQRAGH